jgi:hypothetical protein
MVLNYIQATDAEVRLLIGGSLSAGDAEIKAAATSVKFSFSP